MWRITPESQDVAEHVFEQFLKFYSLALENSKAGLMYARAGELVARLSGVLALSDAVMDPTADLFR